VCRFAALYSAGCNTDGRSSTAVPFPCSRADWLEKVRGTFGTSERVLHIPLCKPLQFEKQLPHRLEQLLRIGVRAYSDGAHKTQDSKFALPDSSEFSELREMFTAAAAAAVAATNESSTDTAATSHAVESTDAAATGDATAATADASSSTTSPKNKSSKRSKSDAPGPLETVWQAAVRHELAAIENELRMISYDWHDPDFQAVLEVLLVVRGIILNSILFCVRKLF
jgi:hypothetical protein